jgi:hypothetical protein
MQPCGHVGQLRQHPVLYCENVLSRFQPSSVAATKFGGIFQELGNLVFIAIGGELGGRGANFSTSASKSVTAHDDFQQPLVSPAMSESYALSIVHGPWYRSSRSVVTTTRSSLAVR